MSDIWKNVVLHLLQNNSYIGIINKSIAKELGYKKTMKNNKKFPVQRKRNKHFIRIRIFYQMEKEKYRVKRKK